MNINDVIFIDSLPKIDLHSLDRESARVMIEDFIRDNKKMKNEIVVIIHGIGSGIIRKTTIETLKKSKDIIEYKSFYNNMGCTLAHIKLEKNPK